MSEAKLRLQSPSNSPLSLKIYCTEESYTKNSHNFTLYKNNLEQLLNHPMSGFQHLNDLEKLINDCVKIKQQFSDKTHLVHIGMGGSVLAAEVLQNSLGFKNSPITILNNLDADDIHEKISSLNLEKCLFYVVSKSGNTLETHLMMDIVLNNLQNLPSYKNLNRFQILKQTFVFATDPEKGPLRKMGKDHAISCLDIPANLGGRFCAFSVVTFLPALFLQINLQDFCEGAKKVKNFFMYQDQFKILLQFAVVLLNDYENQKKQTVLMPYSSKLTAFTHWFAQLWGESLGKNNRGLTPIVAHGPADQHSLLQLFVDGPQDKDFIFLKLHQTKNQYSHFSGELEKNKNLTQIVHAQLEGTMASLQRKKASLFLMEIEQLDAIHLGMLLYFFEFLTVTTGAVLSVDPYDQPGVETGKILTKAILKDGNSPLLN
jgi:glucose-6-phosphate isomerase